MKMYTKNFTIFLMCSNINVMRKKYCTLLKLIYVYRNMEVFHMLLNKIKTLFL